MVFNTHPFQEVARESDLVPHKHVWLKCLAQFEWAERKPGVSWEWAKSEPKHPHKFCFGMTVCPISGSGKTSGDLTHQFVCHTSSCLKNLLTPHSSLEQSPVDFCSHEQEAWHFWHLSLNNLLDANGVPWQMPSCHLCIELVAREEHCVQVFFQRSQSAVFSIEKSMKLSINHQSDMTCTKLHLSPFCHHLHMQLDVLSSWRDMCMELQWSSSSIPLWMCLTNELSNCQHGCLGHRILDCQHQCQHVDIADPVDTHCLLVLTDPLSRDKSQASLLHWRDNANLAFNLGHEGMLSCQCHPLFLIKQMLLFKRISSRVGNLGWGICF